MKDFINTWLSLSLSGTLLMAIVLILRQFYKNRLGKRWQYYIWLIVALRFIVPFSPVIYQKAPATPEIVSAPAIAVPASEIVETPAKRPAVEPYKYIFLIWAVTAAMLIVRKVTIYQSFTGYIRSMPSDNISALNLLSDCGEALNIKRSVELYTNAAIASPMLVGLKKPCIVLPERDIPKGSLAHIFTHELIHLKRRDIVYKWFIQLIICLHWFNPFVYLLGRQTDRDCELACDEAVIASLDSVGRTAYGDTLLLFIKSGKSTIASVTLTEGAKQLKERLSSIMNFKTKSKFVTFMTVVLTAAVCISFSALGAWKTQPAAEEKVLYDENAGLYYVIADGADMSRLSDFTVADGSTGIVFAGKDSFFYTGPLSADNIKQLKRRLDIALNNSDLTQSEAMSILNVAENIIEGYDASENYWEGSDKLPADFYDKFFEDFDDFDDFDYFKDFDDFEDFDKPDSAITDMTADNEANRHYYTQGGYFSKNYVIELGWNIPKGDMPDGSKGSPKEISLPGGSKMTVYFSKAAKNFAKDSKAIDAISQLIFSINSSDQMPKITSPYIGRVEYVAEGGIVSYAENACKKNDLIGFSAIFPVLDKSSQDAYFLKLYNDDKLAIFSIAIDSMDIDSVAKIAEKAANDNKMGFFSVALDHLPADSLNNYAETYYSRNNIAGFSIVTGHMSEAQIKEWLDRAKNDRKAIFIDILE